MKRFGQLAERVLWASRLVMIVGVLMSILVALSMLYLATVDVFHLLAKVGAYADPNLSAAASTELRADAVTRLVKIVDGYLLAAVMLIFALGIYELFISPIEVAQNSEFASRILLIRSLDDLKDRLTRLVLVLLVIEFLSQALKLKYQNLLDLLYLGFGILFVGGALYLSNHAVEK
jgi:uncharacterized membrane protein YqhA